MTSLEIVLGFPGFLNATCTKASASLPSCYLSKLFLECSLLSPSPRLYCMDLGTSNGRQCPFNSKGCVIGYSQYLSSNEVHFLRFNLWCAKLLQLSLTLCNPIDGRPQAPLSMGFSRQEDWSRLPCPPLGDLPDPEIEPTFLWLVHCRWILYH